MSEYKAVTGQSFYDVAEITYGDLNNLVKLANDNGIDDLNNINLTGKTFSYDNALIVNQVLHQQLNKNYGTAQNLELVEAGDYDHTDYSPDEYL